jgi:hypothetical protein
MQYFQVNRKCKFKRKVELCLSNISTYWISTSIVRFKILEHLLIRQFIFQYVVLILKIKGVLSQYLLIFPTTIEGDSRNKEFLTKGVSIVIPNY